MKRIVSKTVLALSLGLSASLAAADGAVIANADTGIESASKDEIKDLFLGKESTISGTEVAIFDHEEGSEIRGSFAQNVLDRSESQLSSYWSKQVFTGKGEPPDSGDSSAVADFVTSTSDGVSYVDAGDVPDGVNVIHEF